MYAKASVRLTGREGKAGGTLRNLKKTYGESGKRVYHSAVTGKSNHSDFPRAGQSVSVNDFAGISRFAEQLAGKWGQENKDRP
ncbi:MAG: hypothetical protein ACKV2V_07060 [Blastocatellia bacterium]